MLPGDTFSVKAVVSSGFVGSSRATGTFCCGSSADRRSGELGGNADRAARIGSP